MAQPTDQILPPQMDRIPKKTKIHGHTLSDDFFWFRDKANPKVIPHLNAENEYTEKLLKPYQPLQEQILSELKDRIVAEDETVPAKKDNYYYYSRTRAKEEYPTYCRKKDSLNNKEEVLLDLNKLAEMSQTGSKTVNLSLGILKISPNHKVLAYSIDLQGDEKYSLHFKCLDSGELIEDIIENTYSAFEWGNDSRTAYFTRLNENLRPDRVFKYQLGRSKPNKAQLVYEESDTSFFLNLSKTLSGKYIVIASEGAITSECHTLMADHPDSVPKILIPKTNGVEYSLFHGSQDKFYLLTNYQAKNFRVLTCSTNVGSHKNFNEWQEYLAHSATDYLMDLMVFENHMVIHQRVKGLESFKAVHLQSKNEYTVPLPEQNCQIYASTNMEFNSQKFRFSFSSLVTPPSILEYDFMNNDIKILKEKKIPDYEKEHYTTERCMALSHDGKNIPISLLYKKDQSINGTSPCYLYGYGSYGISMSANYWPNIFSLVDRGYIVAIAHIRGGAEMGRDWYESGKFLKKMNTFLDFISAAEFLITKNYTAKGNIVICGGSAGGLLVGASINLRPDLFGGAIAHVPFVDLINTMLDDSLPLTALEYDEWGDPSDKEFFEYMLTYSPYDNLAKKAYPPLFVTAGLNDPRVTYWEPAKWVAKIRSLRTNSAPTLLFTHMDAGHQGSGGRYKSLQDSAMEYTFILGLLKDSKAHELNGDVSSR